MVQKTAKWVPPRGIRLIDLPQCPQRPFAVQWRVDGRRKTRNFPTVRAQLEFAKFLARGSQSIGVAAYRLDEDEARAWRSFRAQIGTASLDDVLICWERHRAIVAQPMTVAEAVTKYLEAKTAEGIMRVSLSHYEPVFDRLVAAMGQKTVGAVTADDVAKWIAGLAMEPWSRRTHAIRVRSLFHWLRVTRKIEHSPCEGMKPPKAPEDEIAVLAPRECAVLFSANTEHRELCGRLALEAFAGMRFSSAAKIASEDVDFTARGIVLPAAKIKTGRRQFIDGLPGNLWTWLEWSNPKGWEMTPRQYMQAKSLAFVRANTQHPRNCLRHSFATYHVAANKDASRTSVILCHSSPKMLWSHYKGRGTEADGRTWFEILPPG